MDVVIQVITLAKVICGLNFQALFYLRYEESPNASQMKVLPLKVVPCEMQNKDNYCKSIFYHFVKYYISYLFVKFYVLSSHTLYPRGNRSMGQGADQLVHFLMRSELGIKK
jgi:hypothetical protein